jgi:precorrin-3B C17-methyltransferase
MGEPARHIGVGSRAVSGRLTVIGLGPGNTDQLTPQASAEIDAATDFFGYAPYLDRLTLRPDQQRHASDNREELDRSRAALEAAAAGKQVAVVSGGDPGVFAMAAAICEAIESGPEDWRQVDVSIVPGVTAMLAVAARAGAPLGHDFCAISLSDNLKPWDLVERRLRAAAEVGFVMALYNPISRARPWQLGKAFATLRETLPATTPVVFGRAAFRPDERIVVTTLGEADPAQADMATCIIIGSTETRIIERAGRGPLVYSPRQAAGGRR